MKNEAKRERKDRGRIIFIISIIAMILAFIFDKSILSFIASSRTALFTDFFLGLTFVSNTIIIFFFLTSLFLWQERKKRWILPLWLTLFSSVVASFILKTFIGRARPFEFGISAVPLALESSFATWNSSFPSFQAMLAFSALPILDKEFPRFKYAWIAIASLIALSRVYLGVHFLSDVIAGALIGYFIGFIFLKLEQKKEFGRKIYYRIFRSTLRRFNLFR